MQFFLYKLRNRTPIPNIVFRGPQRWAATLKGAGNEWIYLKWIYLKYARCYKIAEMPRRTTREADAPALRIEFAQFRRTKTWVGIYGVNSFVHHVSVPTAVWLYFVTGRAKRKLPVLNLLTGRSSTFCPSGKSINWIEKWFTYFRMDTTSSTTMQSLGRSYNAHRL